MIGPIPKNHPGEWPVVMIWYTKYAGSTIEHIIDVNVDYFEWMVKTFQLVTPKQAQYYKSKTGLDIPEEYIKDVIPYEWRRGDPDCLYMDICRSNDLEGTLLRYRGKQLSMF